MGLLSQILETETSPAAAATCRDMPRPQPDLCSCGSSIFWFSVYLDGVRRCAVCDPAPAQSLVQTYFVDGVTLAEFIRERRLADHRDDGTDGPDAEFWKFPDPWSERILERYEPHEHFGWPILVLKNEFRKPLASTRKNRPH